jgi:hypothetical protein
MISRQEHLDRLARLDRAIQQKGNQLSKKLLLGNTCCNEIKNLQVLSGLRDTLARYTPSDICYSGDKFYLQTRFRIADFLRAIYVNIEINNSILILLYENNTTTPEEVIDILTNLNIPNVKISFINNHIVVNYYPEDLETEQIYTLRVWINAEESVYIFKGKVEVGEYYTKPKNNCIGDKHIKELWDYVYSLSPKEITKCLTNNPSQEYEKPPETEVEPNLEI